MCLPVQVRAWHAILYSRCAALLLTTANMPAAAAIKEAVVSASTAKCGTSILERKSEASCRERKLPNQKPSKEVVSNAPASTDSGLDS
jgi:hypothetical protein